MKGYETITILHPDLTDDEVQETLARYAQIIGENGGEVVKTESWGLKKLGFAIQKQSRGHIGYTLYTGKATAVNELERILRISDQCLRYMTVKLDSVEEAAKQKPALLDDPALSFQEESRG